MFFAGFGIKTRWTHRQPSGKSASILFVRFIPSLWKARSGDNNNFTAWAFHKLEYRRDFRLFKNLLNTGGQRTEANGTRSRLASAPQSAGEANCFGPRKSIWKFLTMVHPGSKLLRREERVRQRLIADRRTPPLLRKQGSKKVAWNLWLL